MVLRVMRIIEYRETATATTTIRDVGIEMRARGVIRVAEKRLATIGVEIKVVEETLAEEGTKAADQTPITTKVRTAIRDAIKVVVGIITAATTTTIEAAIKVAGGTITTTARIVVEIKVVVVETARRVGSTIYENEPRVHQHPRIVEDNQN